MNKRLKRSLEICSYCEELKPVAHSSSENPHFFIGYLSWTAFSTGQQLLFQRKQWNQKKIKQLLWIGTHTIAIRPKATPWRSLSRKLPFQHGNRITRNCLEDFSSRMANIFFFSHYINADMSLPHRSWQEEVFCNFYNFIVKYINIFGRKMLVSPGV